MEKAASRVAPWTAVVAAVVAFGAILTATLVAPWFSWTGNALSDLGHHDRATATVFNGGLMAAGLVGAVFPYGYSSTPTALSAASVPRSSQPPS